MHLSKNQSLSLDDELDIELQAYNELIAEKGRSNFYFFLREILGFKDVNWRTHKSCINGLTSHTYRKLIVMPRGSLKSTIVCVGFAIWLLTRNPNLRIYIDSEVFLNSKNFLRQINGLIQTPTFIELYGDWRPKGKDANWNQSSITITTRTQILKEASITCGSVGTIKVGQHFDVILGDDYNSPKNSETPEGLDKVIRHYKYNQSILEPMGEWPVGLYAIVGTRYASRDLIGHIVDEELGLDQDFESGEYDADDVKAGNGLIL